MSYSMEKDTAQAIVMERIADALERIANMAEAKQEHPTKPKETLPSAGEVLFETKIEVEEAGAWKFSKWDDLAKEDKMSWNQIATRFLEKLS